MQHSQFPMILIKLVSILLFMIGLVFIACEAGEQMSNAFSEIEIVIFQFNWYLFPPEIKVMLPTIIMHSQKPFKLNGFGSYSYNRNVFTKVSFDQ